MDFVRFLWDVLLANLHIVSAAAALYLVIALAHREGARDFGLPRVRLNELEAWVLTGAVIGARIAAVLPQWDLYLRSLVDILRVNLGLSFPGALLGGALALAAGTRRKGLPFWVLADTYALYAPLGIAAHRFACMLYGDCVGKGAPVPFGVVLHGLSQPRYPSDLYEGILTLALFGALLFASARRPGPGALFGIFLVAYPLVRVAVGFTRLPSSAGDIEVELGLVAIGLAFLALRWRQRWSA